MERTELRMISLCGMCERVGPCAQSHDRSHDREWLCKSHDRSHDREWLCKSHDRSHDREWLCKSHDRSHDREWLCKSHDRSHDREWLCKWSRFQFQEQEKQTPHNKTGVQGTLRDRYEHASTLQTD